VEDLIGVVLTTHLADVGGGWKKLGEGGEESGRMMGSEQQEVAPTRRGGRTTSAVLGGAATGTGHRRERVG